MSSVIFISLRGVQYSSSLSCVDQERYRAHNAKSNGYARVAWPDGTGRFPPGHRILQSSQQKYCGKVVVKLLCVVDSVGRHRAMRPVTIWRACVSDDVIGGTFVAANLHVFFGWGKKREPYMFR